MSHSPPNYMEGIPVKICEKYKPPPIISLPHYILHRTKTDEISWLQSEHDFSLENNVLSKIEQWKKMRESQKEKRRERLRKYELERARAVEENQKQLLTAVSYPSAEEFSSDEDDGNTCSPEAAAEGHNVQNESGTVTQYSPSQQRFDTILMPTVVPETYTSMMNSVKTNNASKINYSDFENDTSSPFDNVELKTINDLDILAQVLNVTQIHSNERSSSENSESNKANCEESPKDIGVNGNSIVSATNTYPTSFLQSTNLSFDQPTSVNVNAAIVDKNNFYYCNNLPNNQLYNGYVCTNYDANMHGNNSNLLNYNRMLLNYVNHGNHSTQDMHTAHCEPAMEYSSRSKSKSVPDILKELNDEITDSKNRRIKQFCGKDEALCTQTSPPPSQDVQTPESYLKLSPSLQKLVKNISSMGFPLERVSKVAEKLGNDDKKIFEHLIPLSELLVLGFDEATISEALLKFNNNKEKALDFLIS